MPPKGAAPRHGALNCVKCRQTRPARDFALREDPKAKAMMWATRRWCAGCLLEGGHITRARLATHYATWDEAHSPTRRRTEAESKVLEAGYFNDLIDQACAADDPEAFIRALSRAADRARGAVKARGPRKSATRLARSA